MTWIKKFARLKYVFIFLAVGVLSLTVISILQIRLSDQGMPEILDLQYAFKYDQAFSQIDSYTEKGIALYTWLQAGDMIFLVGYGMFLASLSAFLVMKLFPDRPKLLWISAAGIGAACFDFLENIGIFTMIRVHPGPYKVLAAAVSAAGVIKMLLFYLCAAVCVISAVILAVKSIRKKQAD